MGTGKARRGVAGWRFTAADFARRGRRPSRDEEHETQAACVRWFRAAWPGLRERLFAVPNGGRRDAVTGARLKAEGVVAGVADLILLKPCGGFGALLVEMKTPAGRQSESQRAWERDVAGGGEYRYVVCRSAEEFAREVNGYLAGRPTGREAPGQGK